MVRPDGDEVLRLERQAPGAPAGRRPNKVKRVTAKTKDKQGDKPLERYIRILEVVSGFSNGISLGPIAEMLGLPKATAHRLISGLVETGMLEQVDRGVLCYQAGPRFASLLYAG